MAARDAQDGKPVSDPGAILMQRVQAGDRLAFEELVKTYHADILALSHRYLGDRSLAEDMVQETFLRVYKARARWLPEAAVRTWIYRIASNLCLSQLRLRKRRKTLTLGALSGGIAEAGEARGVADPTAPDPSQHMERQELAARVRQALERLPETQRMALILNKFHDLPYAEIASALDSSVPAVKSLLARARGNLKKLLPEDTYA